MLLGTEPTLSEKLPGLLVTAGLTVAGSVVVGLLIARWIDPWRAKRIARATDEENRRLAHQNEEIRCDWCGDRFPRWFVDCSHPYKPNDPHGRTAPKCRKCLGEAHRDPLPTDSPESYEKSWGAYLKREGR